MLSKSEFTEMNTTIKYKNLTARWSQSAKKLAAIPCGLAVRKQF